jgi:haloacetate dehalogenase
MFEGFETAVVDVGPTAIAFRRGGAGPPLLLLHGFPETHVMWRSVAPTLAEDFMVVCADLRGYGGSGTPPSAPDHAPYAKSAMAGDMVALMERLGFERFSCESAIGCAWLSLGTVGTYASSALEPT